MFEHVSTVRDKTKICVTLKKKKEKKIKISSYARFVYFKKKKKKAYNHPRRVTFKNLLSWSSI